MFKKFVAIHVLYGTMWCMLKWDIYLLELKNYSNSNIRIISLIVIDSS